MLEQLSIRNFAIIEDIEVSFSSGFSSLSGETGSGKSIIIDALSLLLGERSSFDKIRRGKQRAHIEGIFSLSDAHKEKIEELLNESLDDHQLIVSRSLDIGGKSLAKINSNAVPLALLKQISPLLVDIHSQQKDADYLHEDRQGALLDRFMIERADQAEREVLDRYRIAYRSWKSTSDEIRALKTRAENLGNLDDLTYQLQELEKANITENEMEDLEEEKNRLSAFSRMSDRLSAFLEDYQNASGPLYDAKKQLSYIDEENFSVLSEQFSDVYFQMEDLSAQIKDRFESYQDSLFRLESVNERLFFLHGLRKKYGYTTADMLKKKEEIAASIDDISSFEEKLSRLERRKGEEEKYCHETAVILGDIRKKYASMLSAAVNSELRDLYLENAEFRADLASSDTLGPDGADRIVFMLRANVGEAFLPLSKTASLGETSRLNLALKVVFNRYSAPETVILDEIDIGVSGRVGIAMAKKMRELSSFSQVIAISHLAQVCAYSQNHYSVHKEVSGGKTFASIVLLSKEERLTEMAKMISGEVSSVSISAAEEILKGAV